LDSLNLNAHSVTLHGESAAARSGPSSRVSRFVLANPEKIMGNKMNRRAMLTQEPFKLTTMQVRVLTGIARISHAVEIDGKSG
jgi:hypothetical protein